MAAASTNQLTVEAWIEVDSVRAEAVQTAVAEWGFSEAMDGFVTYDAGSTGGLPTQGFFGAVYVRGHVYFSPQCNNQGRHGMALRYAVVAGFDEPTAWQSFDASAINGLDTRGYYGCLADDRYVYYVPRLDGGRMHQRVLRFDTTGSFADKGSWSAHDAQEPISHQGGAFDGRYAYFAPGYHADSGPSGQVLRYDSAGDFHQASSWQRHNVTVSLGARCCCYDGAVFDGRHVYFVPLEGGDIVRHDPAGDFQNAASWEAFDPRTLSASGEAVMCVGAIFDGRYVYFTPYAHGKVLRYDTSLPFTDCDSWSTYDAAQTGGLDCRGYDGACFDGRYVYFIPFWEGEDGGRGFHARLLRYDTLLPFASSEAWQAADGAVLAPPNPGGFNGGAFDGRFLYMAPWRQDDPDGQISAHGQVLRYDTAATDARFQLRWMDCGHNGGLGGSLPGPSFIVNTTAGAISIQAHRIPCAGRHHLAGVVNGQRVTLWLDGEQVAAAQLTADIAIGGAHSTVGELGGGASPLLGKVLHHRVSDTAISVVKLRQAQVLLNDDTALANLT